MDTFSITIYDAQGNIVEHHEHNDVCSATQEQIDQMVALIEQGSTAYAAAKEVMNA